MAPSANRGGGDILGLHTVDRALTMSGRVNARDTVARETRLSSVSNACPEAGRAARDPAKRLASIMSKRALSIRDASRNPLQPLMDRIEDAGRRVDDADRLLRFSKGQWKICTPVRQLG